jgi:hypothetical protein
LRTRSRHLKKADDPLREAILASKPETPIRAVLLLGSEETESGRHDASRTVDPTKYPSRSAYREHLIERQKKHLASLYGETLQRLRDLDLRVQGGNALRAVVAEGEARQILESLALPHVRRDLLDRPVELIRPRKPSK